MLNNVLQFRPRIAKEMENTILLFFDKRVPSVSCHVEASNSSRSIHFLPARDEATDESMKWNAIWNPTAFLINPMTLLSCVSKDERKAPVYSVKKNVVSLGVWYPFTVLIVEFLPLFLHTRYRSNQASQIEEGANLRIIIFLSSHRDVGERCIETPFSKSWYFIWGPSEAKRQQSLFLKEGTGSREHEARKQNET